MPAFLRDAADNDARLRKFIEQASSDAGVVTFAPRKPPLKLSYSTITDFEMCGLCFYVKYVLGLDEPKTTALAVGGVAHLALEKFYKERRAAEAEGVVPPGRERLLELGAVEFERQSPRDAQGRREMRDKITGMLEHAYDDLHNDADEVLETELSIRMRFRLPDEPDDAPAHQFIAKIDRVDRTPSGGFRVVDYKTGAATKTKLEIPKTDLQMSIYALALSVWLNADMPANGEAFDAVRLDQVEPIEGEAQYWVLSEGERGSIPFSSLNLEKAAEKVHAAARAMLDGKYEKGKNCKGLCAYIGR